MARARGQAPGSGGRRRPRRGSAGTGPRGESAGLLLLLLQVLPPGAAAGPGRRGTRGAGGVCWPSAAPAFPRDARLLLFLPPPPPPPPSSAPAASSSRMVISAPRRRRGRAGERGVGAARGKGGQPRAPASPETVPGASGPPPPPTTAALGSRQSAPLRGPAAGSAPRPPRPARSPPAGAQAAGKSLHLPAPRPGRGGDSACGPAFSEGAPRRLARTEWPGRPLLALLQSPGAVRRAELGRPAASAGSDPRR